MSIAVAGAIALLLIVGVLALVLIHNHNAVANASAQLDALAIKVDPVIRASDAEIAKVIAQAQARVDPLNTSPAAPAQAQGADVAGAQPAAAPAQAQ